MDGDCGGGHDSRSVGLVGSWRGIWPAIPRRSRHSGAGLSMDSGEPGPALGPLGAGGRLPTPEKYLLTK